MADWRASASCLGWPAEWWFSDDRTEQAQAKKVCAGCPVANRCLKEARRNKEKHGIWGGHDFGEPERQKKYARRVA